MIRGSNFSEPSALTHRAILILVLSFFIPSSCMVAIVRSGVRQKNRPVSSMLKTSWGENLLIAAWISGKAASIIAAISSDPLSPERRMVWRWYRSKNFSSQPSEKLGCWFSEFFNCSAKSLAFFWISCHVQINRFYYRWRIHSAKMLSSSGNLTTRFRLILSELASKQSLIPRLLLTM